MGYCSPAVISQMAALASRRCSRSEKAALCEHGHEAHARLLFHDPFGGGELGMGLDADGFTGDVVLEDEGFLDDGGLAGDGVFDFGGFAGEAGDVDIVFVCVGGGGGEDDDAVFGVVFALEEFAEDAGGAFEEAVVGHGFNFVEDFIGDVFEGGDGFAGIGEELEVGGEEDVAAAVVDDGVAHVPEGLLLALDVHGEAFEGTVAEVEFPGDGDDGGLWGGAEGRGGGGEESGAGGEGEGEKRGCAPVSCAHGSLRMGAASDVNGHERHEGARKRVGKQLCFHCKSTLRGAW